MTIALSPRPLRFNQYELPAAFTHRYRPVKIHPHERGLAAFVLDESSLNFFRRSVTAESVPTTAIWAVHSVSGQSLMLHHHHTLPAVEALGYVVCEATALAEQVETFPIPPRLGYRVRIQIATLRNLAGELMGETAIPDRELLAAFIEQRIERLQGMKV